MKKEYVIGNKRFKVDCTPDGCERANCSIYEYRPNRKFFKFGFFPVESYNFWIEKFPSIEDGIIHQINMYLAEKKAEQERSKKWQNFYKNS